MKSEMKTFVLQYNGPIIAVIRLWRKMHDYSSSGESYAPFDLLVIFAALKSKSPELSWTSVCRVNTAKRIFNRRG